MELKPWKVMFDGSKTEDGVGAGVVLASLQGQIFQYSYQLNELQVQSNNQAEYEALIIGFELARSLKIPHLKVYGDSQLVIRQVIG